MARRTHFAVERLSVDAQVVVQRGLREKWTFTKIVAEVLAATGEKVAQSSLARYASKWAAQTQRVQEKQDQAAAFVSAVKAGNLSAAEMTEALLTQALIESSAALLSVEPDKLSREQREFQKLELKRQEIQIRREELELDRRKLDALEAKQKAIDERVKQAVAPENADLTEAEKSRIRKIYGLDAAA
jgi:hypothetical protein